ncbi:MAG: Crp/Fnr family transcriptional regulator [Acidobacteriota bacterium]|nr:Crp/Fnr family transcriptional regulator [Acidobacteriota bacterium]
MPFAESATQYEPGDVIYNQGDPSEQVMYLQSGSIKLSVLSSAGKFGVIAMLSPGQFFGEGSLAGQPFRTATARAVGRCSVISMSKTAMAALLYRQDDISSRFIAHILARNARIEDDLIDHLFHPAEKRLARTLLLLANDLSDRTPLVTVPPIAQETLAEMVGTTRSRVNFFLNRFKSLGFIEYQAGRPLTVNTTLLTALLYD